MRLHDVMFSELDVTTLHDILRLRVDIFVVEQACPYPEIDGRDVEPDARHIWLADETVDEAPIASYLRVLRDPDDSTRIGRVITDPRYRRRDLAAQLMQHVLDRYPAPFVLDAQSHLAFWYGRFGFEPTGPEYLDDGIPHVPMARTSDL